MKHLHVRLPNGLLAALDKFAKERGYNRSQAARLAVERFVNEQEPYIPPTLPNWQVEAWEALLNGLFGTTHLALIDAVRPMLIEAVAALDERGARVLRLRFGLDGPRHTGAEVAMIMGWADRQRVHQVEVEALERMRGLLRRSGIWGLLEEQLNAKEIQ